MSNKMTRVVTFLIILGLAVGFAGCEFLYDKVIDIIMRSAAEMEFEEREDSAEFTTPRTVDIADELDDALAGVEPPMTRADIIAAHLLAGSYEVTMLRSTHDWEIEGRILIEREDIPGSPVTIVNYESESLTSLLTAGEKYASLNAAGVTVFQDALAAYIAGSDPVLKFTVANDAVTPEPSPADSLIFDWTGRMYLYVQLEGRPTVWEIFP